MKLRDQQASRSARRNDPSLCAYCGDSGHVALCACAGEVFERGYDGRKVLSYVLMHGVAFWHDPYIECPPKSVIIYHYV